MKAVILSGGLGTRLRPLTINKPKTMVPVLNIPFLEYVIRRLRQHNVSEVVLALNYLPQTIKDYFGSGSRFGIKLNYIIEESPLGTAGAVKNAERFLNESFLVLNGDIFTDLDLTAMMDFHSLKKAKVTIALTPVDDPTSYGLVETDAHGRVTRFLEKPSWSQVTTNMINAGTYILEPEVLSSIPPQTRFSFEREVFPPLLEQGEPIYAYPSDCYWMDIGTPEKYTQLNKDLLNGRSNQYHSDTQIVTGEQDNIHQTAQITGSVVLGDNCTIGQKTKLSGPVVIDSDCRISEGAIVEDSIIWSAVDIEAGATIRRSIIAKNCLLGAGSVVEDSILGDNVTVADGYKLEPNSRIQPGTRVG